MCKRKDFIPDVSFLNDLWGFYPKIRWLYVLILYFTWSSWVLSDSIWHHQTFYAGWSTLWVGCIQSFTYSCLYQKSTPYFTSHVHPISDRTCNFSQQNHIGSGPLRICDHTPTHQWHFPASIHGHAVNGNSCQVDPTFSRSHSICFLHWYINPQLVRHIKANWKPDKSIFQSEERQFGGSMETIRGSSTESLNLDVLRLAPTNSRKGPRSVAVDQSS